MKGLYAWIGFPSASVPYERPARFAGKTKWDYWRLWNFAIEGISSHSSSLLRAFTYVGVLAVLASALLGLWLLIDFFLWSGNPHGFYLTIFVILFFSSLVLINLGLLGEYVGRIYDEVKQRPLYFTRSDWKAPREPPLPPPPASPPGKEGRR
jgi:glycosyltransferase involved in cell wall biosynthesis